MNKRTLKSLLCITMSIALVVSTVVFNSVNVSAKESHSVKQAGNGNWYCYNENNDIDYSYNGLASNEAGWWKITDGAVDFSYNGLASNENGWWKVTNGAVDFGYSGITNNENGWWYITGGAVDFGYNGIASNDAGWWKITNGAVDFGYNGLASNDAGWWKITNGAVDFGYNGLASNEAGWWKITNGAVDFNYTGMANNEAGWWYVKNGAVDFGYTGLANNENGWWYYQNGTIDFSFNGKVTVDGQEYTVVNGKVSNLDTTYTVGNEATGPMNEGIYIIRSNSNTDYALTAVEDTTAQGGYNVVMSKVTGKNNQKFMVVKNGNGYIFMSMAYLDKDGNNPDKKWLINSYNGGWSKDGKVDNVQITSNSVDGAKIWNISETTSGVYMINVIRGDDYKFYMNAEGGVAENANVGTAEKGDVANQSFNFVSPYSKTLDDGAYSFTTGQDYSKAIGINASSVKDNASVVVSAKSAANDQLFNVTCVDSQKGLYTIQNINSQRYLYTKGSTLINAPIMQLSSTNQQDQLWYIEKNTDGTYSVISANSNQVLNCPSSAEGTQLVQAIGNDSATQKFMVSKRIETSETIKDGIYAIGSNNYRIESMGMGVYSIYSISSAGYCTANNNGISYMATDDGIASKWKIASANNMYTIQSVSNGKYLTSSAGLSDSTQSLTLADMNATQTSYEAKYDLSTLKGLDATSYGNTQILKRLNYFNIRRSDLMDPVANKNTLEQKITNNINTTLPTNIVQFNGNTVRALNIFMRENMGKVIQLTQDIQVYIDPSVYEDGIITVPSNTILDGNDHKLVMKVGYSQVPSVGIVFYYFENGVNQKVSKNCGVKNLTSAIPYLNNTLNAYGADNILIQNNCFSNAKLNAVVVADRDNNNDYTVGGIIKGNTFASTGEDTIGVYGNISQLILSDNTISNSGEYGIMLSCLRDGKQMRVDQELIGPHDIIVKNNDISKSEACAVYSLGSYRTYITDNKLYESKLEGICLDSGTIGAYFAGNDVENNGLSGGLPGVSIDNSIYNIIDNNTVSNNAHNGIKLVRTALGNIIVNNTCVSNTTSSESSGTSAGITIETKDVDASNAGYLDGYGSDCNVIYNNTVSGSHVHGIMISEDCTSGKNMGNVIKFNRLSKAYPYTTVDFSTSNNILKDNIIQ